MRFAFATNPTSHVSKVLYYDGPGAFEYTLIFEKLITRCRAFADVGSNTGYYAVLAAKINPGIHVYAFEPSPGPLYFLLQNIKLNKVGDRVEAVPVALSDKPGKLLFQPAFNPKYAFLEHHLGGTGHEVADQSQSVEVTSDTLDHFLGDRPVDLIKLDTEGTEDQILTGATTVIQKHRPIIICETLFNKIEESLEAIMKGHGYAFYNHRNGKLLKTETLKRAVDNGVRDCFFVPAEKQDWIQEHVSV